MIVTITIIGVALIIGVTTIFINHQNSQLEKEKLEHEMTMQAMNNRQELKTKMINLEDYRMKHKVDYSEEYKNSINRGDWW